MAPPGRVVAGIRALLRREHIEREMDEELRAYLEIATERKMAVGLSREQAMRAARIEMGGAEAVKDHIRDAGWESIVDSLWQDVRYAIRGLRRSPGFATVAVLTLALGIGANTAIFSVVHAVLLRPLPYVASGRLVRIFEILPPRQGAGGSGRESPLAHADLAAFRSHAATLSHVGVHVPAMITMAGHDGPIRLVGVRLSPDLFSMLDATALLGRTLDTRDAAPDAEAVVVLSSAAWERYFSRDPAILGQRVDLDGKGYSIVGVMPGDFWFPEGRSDFWLPLAPPTSGPNMRQRLPLTARVKEGVSMSEAEAEVSAVLTQLRLDSSGNAGAAQAAFRFSLVGLQELLVAPVKAGLLVLTVSVGFVLLIAFVNVGNLLLARATARQREIAIRLALGAGRGRLLRQALTESMVLALVGGAAGTLIAFGGLQLFRTLGAAQPDMGPGVLMPRLAEVGIDLSVLGFTITISLVAGVVFGLTPAVRQSRVVPDALHAGAAVLGINSIRQRRLQGVLVVAEIGMAMMLLIGGGLLIRSFVNLLNVRPGYDPDHVLTFKASLPPGRSDAQLGVFGQDLAMRLETLPRVRSAGYGESLPLVRIARLAGLAATPEMPRAPEGANRAEVTARTVSVRIVSRQFLSAMGSRLVSGRGFAESDGAGQAQVMLVNQTLARRIFLGEDPLGKQMYVLGSVTFDPRRLAPSGPPPRPWQIVGIVEDVRQASLDQEPGPEIYVDFRQLPGPSGPPGSARYFALRVEGDPMSMASSIRGIARQLDSQAMVENVAPMEQLVSSSIARPRLYAVLMGLFAGVATALSAIGIFGVMAYSVEQRTREIGVRMALGAQPAGVVRLVLGRSLALTAVGILVGLGAAMAVARYLETLLFGLTPLDPVTFLAVSVLFAAVATMASVLPARRVTRADPLIALRAE